MINWSVTVIEEETLPYLAGVGIDEFYLDPESCVRAYKLGRSRLTEVFRGNVSHPSASCPPLSYGHVACLGCRIVFPEGSEPYAKPVFSSLDEGIEVLEGEIDFKANPLFVHYQKMHRYLVNAFPNERIPFGGFGWEGPITSAGLLRGQGFFSDIHKEPNKAEQFLKLLTKSIIMFIQFIREVNGEEKIDRNSGGLADDFASFIHPSLWTKFVIPYWDQYYRGITTGRRVVHCENLSPGHLRYLAEIGIAFYEPSVSPKLNPKIIRKLTDIPFNWLLPTFKLATMTEEEVRQWVIQVAGMGVNHMWVEVDKSICEGNNPNKISAFVNACKEIDLGAGSS